MIEPDDKGSRMLADLADRHGVSQRAVEQLLAAVMSGGGNQAQFNIPELGGMGQWSSGGMAMIGDMFNNDLKAKVADLCRDLAALGRDGKLPLHAASARQKQDIDAESGIPASASSMNWWPAELGTAGSAGSQNDMRYALFPSINRLAIKQGDQVAVYDTGDHRITGFSQQQGGNQSLTFTSQHGPIRLADLREVQANAGTEAQTPTAAPAVTASPAGTRPKAGDGPADGSDHDIYTKIERLADLHAKGILKDDEFHAKKRELLDRL